MELENVAYEVSEGIATITVNRPKALNALNGATLGELERAFQEAETSPEAGAVILTGAGDRAFVAGADIAEMSEMGPAAAKEYAERGQGVLDRIERLPKPVVAAVNGYAFGGGCEIAMACHMRIASDKAVLGQPEVKLGLIPGFAGTQRLPRLVGKGRALEILLTGEPVKAEEALRIGLVNRVVAGPNLMEEARALCKTILARGPVAVRCALEAVRRGLESGQAEGCALEAALFALVFTTHDMREGTRAFLEKRAPKFEGR
jgi:enoyl-CoA hydratase/carnithine racemase